MTSIIHTQDFWERKKAAIEKKTKVCIKCKKEKNKSLFTTDTKHKDGKHPVCNECKKIAQRELYRKQPEKFVNTVKRWAKKNREKVKAHAALNQAVFRGKIIKPSKCQRCGRESDRIEGHHWKGYEKEHIYDVMWLCHSCHEKMN